jgi:hypothetical protein
MCVCVCAYVYMYGHKADMCEKTLFFNAVISNKMQTSERMSITGHVHACVHFCVYMCISVLCVCALLVYVYVNSDKGNEEVAKGGFQREKRKGSASMKLRYLHTNTRFISMR